MFLVFLVRKEGGEEVVHVGEGALVREGVEFGFAGHLGFGVGEGVDGVAEFDELPVGVGGEHGVFEFGDVCLGDEGVVGAVEDEDGGLGFGGVGFEGGGGEVAVEGDDGIEVGAGAAELEDGAASEAEADGGGFFFVERGFLFEEGGEGELGAGTHHAAVGTHGSGGLTGFLLVGGADVDAIHVGDEDDSVGAGDFGGFLDGGVGDAHPVGDHENGGGGFGEGVVVNEDAFELGVGVGIGDFLLDDFGGSREGEGG